VLPSLVVSVAVIAGGSAGAARAAGATAARRLVLCAGLRSASGSPPLGHAGVNLVGEQPGTGAHRRDPRANAIGRELRPPGVS
jgi:hypothetical protein